MTNYAERAVDTAYRHMPGEDQNLIQLYTLLALVKGEATTMADVHDAWSLWRNRSAPDHSSIVPFDQLLVHIREYDRPYMEAIHKAVRELAGTDDGGGERLPGTYWETAVLQRFVDGGPVDLDTVRLQVGAVLDKLLLSGAPSDPTAERESEVPR